MSERKKRLNKKQLAIISAVGGLLLLCLVVVFIKSLLSGVERPKKKSFQMVTLLAPPPPPKLEKIPPQETSQEKIQNDDMAQPNAPADQANEQPPAQNLGVDAEGGSGSDGFGLEGRKGGQGLIGRRVGLMLRVSARPTISHADEYCTSACRRDRNCSGHKSCVPRLRRCGQS